MIQKFSKLVPVDRSGVFKVKVFQLYGGSKRKVSYPGGFTKVSAIQVKPENNIKRKTKMHSILVRLVKESLRVDGSWVKFKINGTVLLKKRLTPRGKELTGPIDFTIKRRKFVSSFSGSI